LIRLHEISRRFARTRTGRAQMDHASRTSRPETIEIPEAFPA
jgi:hypothetical protein